MAALTVTETTKRLPVGDRVMQTFKTSALGTASATEWIATGLSWVDAIVGVSVHGTVGGLSTPNVVRNAQGTGVAEDTNPGDVGIEVIDAGTNVVEVTVIGIP